MESTPVPVTTVARHLAMGLGCQNFTCGGYGTVDEANAIIGIALLRIADANVRDALIRIQNDLFDLGADPCRPEREHRKVEPLRVSQRQLTWAEETIDSMVAANGVEPQPWDYDAN
jgi:cob(I)alamin adenosyltransferase